MSCRIAFLTLFICGATPALQKLLKCDEYVNRVEVNEDQIHSEICTFSYVEIYEPNDIQISSATVQDVDYESNVNELDVSSTITTVNFVNSRLSRLPNAAFLKFRNVKTLNCDGVNLQSLEKHDISAAKSLEHFSCNSNYIKSLGAMLFANSTRLKTLDLSINVIESIESTAFSELKELTKLLLYDNRLKIVAEELFKDLISLSEINLSTNRIFALEQKLFANCKLLKYIYLKDNSIQHLSSALLTSIENIAFLEVSNNLLTHLDLNISASALYANNNQLESIKLHSIGYLSFYNNSINSMDFAHADHVLSLNVSSNKLNSTSIQTISLLSEVKSLDLSFNSLGALNVTTFLELTELQILNLQATNLSRLEYGLFVHQAKLEQLDLSYNHLAVFGTFEMTKLSPLKSLEVLFIEGNNIMDLDFRSAKKILPKLRMLGLSDNNWKCPFLSEMIASLESNDIEIYHLMMEKSKSNVHGIACNEGDEINYANKSLSDASIHHKFNASDNKLMAILEKFEAILQHVNKTNGNFVSKTELINELSLIKANMAAMEENLAAIEKRVDKLPSRASIINATIQELASIKSTENKQLNDMSTGSDFITKAMITIIFVIVCGFTVSYVIKLYNTRRIFARRRVFRASTDADTINENIL